MKHWTRTVATLVTLLIGLPALAQSAPQGARPLPSAPPEQLLAGLRNYPDELVDALLVLADQPDAIRHLAEKPDLFQRPESIEPKLSSEQRDAVRKLASVPEIIFIAAARADELKTVRRQIGSSPRQLDPLRNAYMAADDNAHSAFQEMLDREPSAVDEYAALVASFVRDQQAAMSDFPYARVTNRSYYRACPPDEPLMAYADQKGSPHLKAMLTAYWNEFSPEQIDKRVRNGEISQASKAAPLAFAPRAQREGSWAKANGKPGEGDYIPIIMQPGGDQPDDARMAFAVSEQARLWLPQPTAAERSRESRAAQSTPPPADLPSPVPTRAPETAREPVMSNSAEIDDGAATAPVERAPEPPVVEHAPVAEAPVVEAPVQDVPVEPVYTDPGYIEYPAYYPSYYDYPFYSSFAFGYGYPWYFPSYCYDRWSYLHCYPYVYPGYCYSDWGFSFGAHFGYDHYYHDHHFHDGHHDDHGHFHGDDHGHHDGHGFGDDHVGHFGGDGHARNAMDRVPGRFFGPGNSVGGAGDTRRGAGTGGGRINPADGAGTGTRGALTNGGATGSGSNLFRNGGSGDRGIFGGGDTPRTTVRPNSRGLSNPGSGLRTGPGETRSSIPRMRNDAGGTRSRSLGETRSSIPQTRNDAGGSRTRSLGGTREAERPSFLNRPQSRSAAPSGNNVRSRSGMNGDGFGGFDSQLRGRDGGREFRAPGTSRDVSPRSGFAPSSRARSVSPSISPSRSSRSSVHSNPMSRSFGGSSMGRSSRSLGSGSIGHSRSMGGGSIGRSHSFGGGSIGHGSRSFGGGGRSFGGTRGGGGFGGRGGGGRR